MWSAWEYRFRTCGAEKVDLSFPPGCDIIYKYDYLPPYNVNIKTETDCQLGVKKFLIMQSQEDRNNSAVVTVFTWL